jgi:hypothetical protein
MPRLCQEIKLDVTLVARPEDIFEQCDKTVKALSTEHNRSVTDLPYLLTSILPD